ncbi:MAG: hypothetical protein JNL28_09065 [Planctomycetes bacterium]|nr:hypothetical protein [Planctomycetota bacterium]
MQSVVPRPDVAPVLQAYFVALASDADDPEDAVLKHAHELEDAYMLPFVMFIDSSGKFLEGFAGAANPISFAATLKRVAGIK